MLEEHNKQVKSHFDEMARTKHMSQEEADKLLGLMVGVDKYPLVGKKSRSFKEIAQGLVS